MLKSEVVNYRGRPHVVAPSVEDKDTERAVPTLFRTPPPLSCHSPVITSARQGSFRFDKDGRRFEAQPDGWSFRAGETQQMQICAIDSWKATVNCPGVAGDGVSTYPDSQRTFTDWDTNPGPLVSKIDRLSSPYAHVAPDAGAYDWAFDLFFGDPFLEVMVFTQWRDLWVPPAQMHMNEKDGDSYDVYRSGSYVQMRQVVQTDHGIIHWVPIFKWLEKQGVLSPEQTLTFLAYGVEVLSTYSKDVPFQLTGFDVHEYILP